MFCLFSKGFMEYQLIRMLCVRVSGKDSHNKCKDMDCSGCSTDESEACSNKMIQIIIVVLVFIMAVW